MKTNPWTKLQEMEPVKLTISAQAVDALHQKTVEATAPPEGAVEKLRRLLMQTDEEDLGILLGQLARRELTAIADFLAGDPERVLREKAVILGTLAKFRPLTVRAWRLMVTGAPAKGLFSLLKQNVDAGLHDVIAEEAEDQKRIASWFEGDDLASGMFEEVESSGQSLDDWFNSLPITSTRVAKESRLLDEVELALLSKGSRSTLLNHKGQLVERAMRLHRDGYTRARERFIANYLLQFRQGQSWDENIVSWALKSFNPHPTPPNLVDFWRRVDSHSPGVVQEVLSWLALKRIERFFSQAKDPHGRFRFWRDNFAKDLVDAQLVADEAAVLLHIPPLAIVEFAEMGNAAYVYREAELRWLRTPGYHGVTYYKDRSKLIDRPSNGSEFRIRHQGDWQGRYLGDLKTVLRRR